MLCASYNKINMLCESLAILRFSKYTVLRKRKATTVWNNSTSKKIIL